MVPYTRFAGSLVIALAASAADGATPLPMPISAPAFVGAVEEIGLDRNPAATREAGPFLAYSVEASLESEACASQDKNRQLRGRIESAVVRVASEQLNLPMGSGRFLPVRGRTYLFCLEPHYREPGTGHGPTGWHKGVTVYEAS